MRAWSGIFDAVEFPQRLAAHVVEPGDDPRVRGYAAQSDLARGVGFLDVAWLALMGELPTEAQREALSTALTWLCPVHVGEGPAHAAVLARIAGAPDEVVPGVAAVTLGQHIASELRALAGLFAWLDARCDDAPPPAAVQRDASDAQRILHAELARDTARWFGDDRALPAEPVLTRVAAGYAVLHRLGAQSPAQRQALVILARLPAVLGEASHAQPGAVMTYPADLPPYRYVEDEVT